MGCTSYENIDYDSNQKEDYLTRAIFESIMSRKRAQVQAQYDFEQEEEEKRERNFLRQQALLNSLDTKGPKSYVDNLITSEIPRMEFGIKATEEELVKDLNDRDCDEYKEGEYDEEEDEEKIKEEAKKEEEKNQNEIDELKKQIEEMNKKEEEEKNPNKKKKRERKKGLGGFLGKKNEKGEQGEEGNEEKKEEDIKIEQNEEEKKEKSSKSKLSKINEEENKEKSSKNKLSKIDEEEIKDKSSKNRLSKINEEDEGKESNNKKRKKNKNNMDEEGFEGEEEENEEREKEESNQENEEENELDNNEEENNYKKKKKGKNKKKNKEEKKSTNKKPKENEKLKALMELKPENPSYADKIKRYKYPKKNDEETENKLEFPPSPAELIISVIGDEKSGKTSFIKKYTRNVFEETYQKTENIDTYDEIETEINSKKIKLTILDTPPLTKRKNIKLIQEKGINKSHIIIYIVDINDEHAEFKVRLMAQSFEFNFKQIIVVIGNKSDKASIYSSKNEEAIDDYCYGKRFIFNVISCSDTSKSEIENFMNGHVIKEYLTLYNK